MAAETDHTSLGRRSNGQRERLHQESVGCASRQTRSKISQKKPALTPIPATNSPTTSEPYPFRITSLHIFTHIPFRFTSLRKNMRGVSDPTQTCHFDRREPTPFPSRSLPVNASAPVVEKSLFDPSYDWFCRIWASRLLTTSLSTSEHFLSMRNLFFLS